MTVDQITKIIQEIVEDSEERLREHDKEYGTNSGYMTAYEYMLGSIKALSSQIYNEAAGITPVIGPRALRVPRTTPVSHNKEGGSNEQ